MKILVYGAGVIGCLYGSPFAEAGHGVRILARCERLNSLTRYGLPVKAPQEMRRLHERLYSYLGTLKRR